MIELGQLEARHQDFDSRNAQIVVVSLEGQDLAALTQKQVSHLVVVADPDHKLIDAVEVLHLGANPYGGDAAAPTTILVDGQGTVRWLFRPNQITTRLAPDEVLAAMDANLPHAK